MEDNALGSKAINWAKNKPDYRGSKWLFLFENLKSIYDIFVYIL
jgi:hypothetical protein